MKSQRGSMAVVALVMMLFLLIAGVAWLPMLAQEHKIVQNDWEEQQAWYAAEAGFVRAKTELNNSADGGDWGWLAKSSSNTDLKAAMQSIKDEVLIGTKQANYAVYISPELTDNDIPAASTGYTITSVGQVNGIQKILRRIVTTAASSGGDTPTAIEAMVAAGGKITVHNPWMHFNSDGTIFTSAQLTDLNVNPNSDAAASTSNWWGSLSNPLYTHLPDSMFAYPSGTSKGYLTYGGTLNLAAGETVYMDSLQITDWQGAHPAYTGSSINIYGQAGSTVYFTNAVVSKLAFNGITGPSFGKPLNVIIDGNISISNLNFSGNVRIIVNGTLILGGGSGSGNFMFLSNGDITVKQSISSIHNLFLSSDGNINITGDFTGQMQAKGNIDIWGVGATYIFNGDVIKAFSLPSEMTTI
ncbi:MAG: hypothetical protein PHR07_02835 [Acidaminococcaceae bacterium]|nr:hypothetical protein [Acidaminococcaceae bacterium]